MVETYIKTKEVFWQQQMGRLLTPISLSKRWVKGGNYQSGLAETKLMLPLSPIIHIAKLPAPLDIKLITL